ncbi:UNVERIFIED_ORG: P44/Msp2 family outer membrane protein, partial [Anaplasma ovis]
VGVDEGLVIQELSRPEELEKLQHELAKQVSKLAELGELKWLEQLETLETEELEKVAKRATQKLSILEEQPGYTSLEELEKKLKEIEEIRKLKGPEAIRKLRDLERLEAEKLEEVKKKVKGSELAEHLDKTWLLRRIGRVGQELAAIRELKELGLEERLRVLAEIKEVRALAEKQKAGGLEIQEGLQLTEKIRALGGQLDLLEARILLGLEAEKMKEVEAAKEEVEIFLGLLHNNDTETKKIEEVKTLVMRVGDSQGLRGPLVKKLEELAKKLEPKVGGNTGFQGQVGLVKDLKKKLEELAAIREALEQLKVEPALLEGIKREVLTQQSTQVTRRENNPQSKAEGKLEEIRALRKLGQLDELIPEERLRELSKVKETLKRLKGKELVDLERKLETMGELKQEIEKIKGQEDLKQLEARKLEEVKKAKREVFILRTKESLEKEGKLEELRGYKLKKAIKKLETLIEKIRGVSTLKEQWEPKVEKLKSKLETLAAIRELKKLGFKDWLRLRTLEELTEIAEQRGVATVMKAALASAMEIAKNRGWTDYLNSLDVSERANAARE